MVTYPTTGSWDNITTVAFTKMHKELVSQVFTSLPLWEKLLSRGNIVTKDAGGVTFQKNVKYGVSSNVQAFAGMQQLTVQVQNYKLPTIWNWKNIAVTMLVSKEEERQVAGAPLDVFVDLMQEEIDFAMDGMRQYFVQRAFEDGTAENGMTITGLAAHVADNPTTGVLGGIDRAAYSFWRNISYTNCGSFASNGIGGTSNDYFLDAWYDITDGNVEAPDMIIADENIVKWYERKLFTANASGTYQPVILQSEKDIDLGFQGAYYKKVPVYMSRMCPSGYAYMLNTKYFQLVTDREWSFTPVGWTDLTSNLQMGKVNVILWRGELVCMRPNLQAVLSGWTA